MASRARSSAGKSGAPSRPSQLQIEAVGVDVLAEQGDLAHAVGDERTDLGHHGVDVATALGATHLGHDAVRAEVGAAGHDLHPGLKRALAARRQVAAHGRAVGEEARRPAGRPRRRHGRREQLGQAVQVLRPQGAVDEGETPEEVVLLGLRQAAGDEDDAAGVLALEPGGGAQMPGQALVGALAHGAGVVDEHVGAVGSIRALQAFGLEQRADALGVVGVHLAAERAQVVSAHGLDGASAPPPPTWRCRRRGSRGSR